MRYASSPENAPAIEADAKIRESRNWALDLGYLYPHINNIGKCGPGVYIP
jgi:hypothetical protein